MSILAERIKQRREYLKLSQDELADLIGKDQKQIWRYENARTQPNATVLTALSIALNTTTDWLLGLTDDPQRPLRSAEDLTDLERKIIQRLRLKSPEVSRKFLELIEVV